MIHDIVTVYTSTEIQPVIAVYPLGFADGPITAMNVVFSRAINLSGTNGSHC